MTKKIIYFTFLAFLLASEDNIQLKSSQNTANILSAHIINDAPIHFGYSYSSGWSSGPFWIGISCQNIDDIAGFQFELPNDLQLLDASGGRAEEFFSDLHHNSKGLILGFSMAAKKIPKIQNSEEDSLLLKMQVKIVEGSSAEFLIKSILAGANGQKLSFSSTLSELSLESDTGDLKLIKISFSE